MNGTRIEYAIEIATDGGTYHRVLNTAVEGKTTTRYQRSDSINLPEAKTGWQLRVCRLTENSTHQRLADRMHIDAFAEIIDAKLRYPNTALLYVEFDASQFQQIPVIACEPQGGI